MRRPDKPIVARIPIDGGGPPEPAKVSEMFHEFIQPLLELDPTGPPDTIGALQNIVEIATICWNLPILEASGDHTWRRTRREFDQMLEQMHPLVRRALEERIRARTSEFAQIPFYVHAWVRGPDLDHATLVAEARMPRSRVT